MIEAASDRLGEEGLLLDQAVLQPEPAADGMQHDETRSVVFRLAGKSDRDPLPEAVLHPTVVERFNLAGVLQYDVVAPYRPEALRGHRKFPGAYDNIPLPRQTCAQRIKAAWQGKMAAPLAEDKGFATLEENAMDRIVSCTALLLLIIAAAIGTVIFAYQCVTWLHSGLWHPMPLDLAVWVGSGPLVRTGSAYREYMTGSWRCPWSSSSTRWASLCSGSAECGRLRSTKRQRMLRQRPSPRRRHTPDQWNSTGEISGPDLAPGVDGVTFEAGASLPAILFSNRLRRSLGTTLLLPHSPQRRRFT
jgi:hypothetical protein